MNTIVVIARRADWERSHKTGEYTQSTITATLGEVGFIHCSFPDQTIDIANRRFAAEEDLVLLLIDENKVKAPVKHEGALSGRAGTFPHIYGPLNVGAVYAVLPLAKNSEGAFIAPDELRIAS
jgi:uncharacterized protein (DUF952 family)